MKIGGAFTHLWIGLPLVYLNKPVLTYCQMDFQKQILINVNHSVTNLIQNMKFEMLSTK